MILALTGLTAAAGYGGYVVWRWFVNMSEAPPPAADPDAPAVLSSPLSRSADTYLTPTASVYGQTMRELQADHSSGQGATTLNPNTDGKGADPDTFQFNNLEPNLQALAKAWPTPWAGFVAWVKDVAKEDGQTGVISWGPVCQAFYTAGFFNGWDEGYDTDARFNAGGSEFCPIQTDFLAFKFYPDRGKMWDYLTDQKPVAQVKLYGKNATKGTDGKEYGQPSRYRVYPYNSVQMSQAWAEIQTSKMSKSMVKLCKVHPSVLSSGGPGSADDPLDAPLCNIGVANEVKFPSSRRKC